MITDGRVNAVSDKTRLGLTVLGTAVALGVAGDLLLRAPVHDRAHRCGRVDRPALAHHRERRRALARRDRANARLQLRGAGLERARCIG
ncbi:MAG TPA: hypothetical protein VEK78_09330 [Gemmatimonadales bacterium]|nr:hypothetical protein [Gemmatimonadales bacterium]HYT84673.1 hypothetical protein [Gemmatimonadales bacterium]